MLLSAVCLSVVLLFTCSGCSRILDLIPWPGGSQSLTPGENVVPRAGAWSTVFSTKTNSGLEENWMFEFSVSEQVGSIESARLFHYHGPLLYDTIVTVLIAEPQAEKHVISFELNFTELSGYSTQTYKIRCAFTTDTEAVGILEIGDNEYSWTATHSSS